jgi:hypothetical protein
LVTFVTATQSVTLLVVPGGPNLMEGNADLIGYGLVGARCGSTEGGTTRALSKPFAEGKFG